MTTILVTGGAGFIGSRLVARLAAAGSRVCVLDNLHPQVHGPAAHDPTFSGEVSFVRADVEDRSALRSAIEASSPDVVYHLAAETGTGQSYDLISRYCSVNVGGTAVLLEELKRAAPHLKKLVLAGSRSVYGEGAHRDSAGRIILPPPRSPQRMRSGDFQPRDEAGHPVTPVPTNETIVPMPSSVYASTKLMQEHLVTQALHGAAVEPVILRFQNVYGPGQSLRNPYTGVLSIFCSQILSGKRLNIYEDGEIVRDFVYVDDVVDALVAASRGPTLPFGPINIGSGETATILDVARTLLSLLGSPRDALDITGQFRAGDIRYAVADITRAGEVLGWVPRTDLNAGLAALAAWAQTEHLQSQVLDSSAAAEHE